LLVATGILLSRVAGLVRGRVFGHYFGDSDVSDAFQAALRIPNFLQNLFGEGVLSASFIPVYAQLLARRSEAEARRVAYAVFSLLALTASGLVLIGVLTTPWLITLIAPGFPGEKRELTIRLVRILFPGAGLLVLSAWCLGVLNSHRRFLISYTAPVLWNLAIIGALLLFRTSAQEQLAVYAAWGAVVGSALQLGVQLPGVLSLLGGLRPVFDTASVHVRTVTSNFVPVFIGRGVVQLSAYVDTLLASFLPSGAVAQLAYAQALSLLPVSLFGMSVSAAELPAMSSAIGDEGEVAAYLRGRLSRGLRRIALFVVPSAVLFLVLGDVVAAAVYQSGRFTRDVTIHVWAILAGSAVGLLATTLGRLYASTYYAMRDTRTPLRFALIRVVLTTALGYLFAFPLPRALGISPRWGVAGLTASAGIAGWVEFLMLRHTLNRRIGPTGLDRGYLIRLWATSVVAAGIAWLVKRELHDVPHPLVVSLLVLAVYATAFVVATLALGVPEARQLVRGALARLGLGIR